ncbi:cytochrome ubiquinol oxidase subunit I [Fodinibius sediminis]|uniref:Cytochrome bd-I ubiquinol oxidase subunit 1 apoprotein n=1 Tax=Fodinibius sediminis TaxID=1214077 RepID=A0A521F2F8_9BACT|nr:cytochrome ubiquinol oxidase subunit I [Fodinibius sediminis]SMO90382.1 cytochrome bd-I ubiquinol oxidase subunit 1 apoprotein [Fodinibius sediminis]
MENLLAARLQMAVSLGFHIIFACVGMAMPFLMAIAEYRWIKSGQQVYQDLAKAWSRGVAIFFATGAVSGTVLSFELGMLWPTFMEHAGPIFGMPFSWEGTAFFVEAIALGLFLYGWDKLRPWTHWLTGLVVGVSGVASGIFVVAANAWMNSPAGFEWVNGAAVNIDPVAAMFNDAWLSQALHMTLAAFVATGFAVAGLHALLLLRDPKNLFHREAVKISLIIGGLAAIFQPLSGDYAAKGVADRQPAKLAAMEGHFSTSQPAPLVIGGIPDEEQQVVHYAIEIPRMLSFLAHGNFDAEVKGLDQIPREEWPPVVITHIAFQIMVASGIIMMLLGLFYYYALWRGKKIIRKRWFLWLIGICTPLGFIAVEAGWIVTEVGRQPWIIYGVMKTRDAVTPMPGLQYSLYLILALYLLLSVIVIWLMYRQIITLSSRYETAKTGG